MFKQIFVKVCFVFGISFLLTSSILAQSHDVPSAVDPLSNFFGFIPEGTNGSRLTLGSYYTESQKFYKSDNSLVVPSTYKNYKRYGVWLDLKQRLFNNLLIGATVPFQKTESWRSRIFYTTGQYELSSLGDFQVYSAWQFFESKKIAICGDLRVNVPGTGVKSSYTSPHIYIGQDGHWGIGAGFSGSFLVTEDLSLVTRYSYLSTLPRRRVLADGDFARGISNNQLSVITGMYDPRDISDLVISVRYKFQDGWIGTLGYEKWNESVDSVSQVDTGGDSSVEQTIRGLVEGPEGGITYAIIGLEFPFLFNSRANFLYKSPMSGQYAYYENIYMLSIVNDF